MAGDRRFGGDKEAEKKAEKKAERKAEKKAEEKAASVEKRSRATVMAATMILPNLFVGTREDAEALGVRVPDGWACISVTEYRSRYKRTEELPL